MQILRHCEGHALLLAREFQREHVVVIEFFSRDKNLVLASYMDSEQPIDDILDDVNFERAVPVREHPVSLDHAVIRPILRLTYALVDGHFHFNRFWWHVWYHEKFSLLSLAVAVGQIEDLVECAAQVPIVRIVPGCLDYADETQVSRFISNGLNAWDRHCCEPRGSLVSLGDGKDNRGP